MQEQNVVMLIGLREGLGRAAKTKQVVFTRPELRSCA
jgi:hypothetical protein